MQSYLRRVRTFRRDIRLFFVFSLLITIGFGVFGLAYNLYLVELGFREDFIGVFNAVFTVSIALGAVSIGAALRRIGTWRALVIGAAGTITMQVALALAEAPPLILGMAVVYGFSIAYLTTTTMPFIIDWGRPSSRPQTASIAFALNAVAATIGSLLGGYVPEIAAAVAGGEAQSPETYRVALISGSVVGVFALIPLLRMREARKGKPRDAGRNTAAKATSAERQQTRKDVSVYIMLGGVLALGLGTVIPFYAVFMISEGISPGSVGFIYALGNLLGALFSLSGPALVQRFGNLRVNFAVRAIMVPVYILLILFPATWVVLFAHMVRSVSLNMGGPLDSTFIADILPPRLQASAIGFRAASWNVGWALSSVIGGWVIVNLGYDWTFAAMVVAVTVASGTFLFYFSRHPMVRAGKVLVALPQRQRAIFAARLAEEAERDAADVTGDASADGAGMATAQTAEPIRQPDSHDRHRSTTGTLDLDDQVGDSVAIEPARSAGGVHRGTIPARHARPDGESGPAGGSATEGIPPAGEGAATDGPAPDRRSR